MREAPKFNVALRYRNVTDASKIQDTGNVQNIEDTLDVQRVGVSDAHIPKSDQQGISHKDTKEKAFLKQISTVDGAFGSLSLDKDDIKKLGLLSVSDRGGRIRRV